MRVKSSPGRVVVAVNIWDSPFHTQTHTKREADLQCYKSPPLRSPEWKGDTGFS